MAAAKNPESPIESDSPISSSSESEGEFEYTEPMDKYSCIICSNIIRNCKELPCGHIGCERCIRKWEKTTYKKDKVYRCSECQQTYNKTELPKSVFVDRLLKEQTNAFCKARDEGCEWVGSINDYKRYHQKQCIHRTIKCPFTGCQRRILQTKMEEHKTNCPQRTIPCILCEDTYAFSKEQLHISDCTGSCINQQCSKILRRVELDNHLANECAYTKISCKYKKYGCEYEFPRHLMNAHIKDFAEQHMALSINIINENINKEFAKVKTQLQRLHQDTQKKDEQLAKKDEQLVKKDEQLARKDEQLVKKDNELQKIRLDNQIKDNELKIILQDVQRKDNELITIHQDNQKKDNELNKVKDCLRVFQMSRWNGKTYEKTQDGENTLTFDDVYEMLKQKQPEPFDNLLQTDPHLLNSLRDSSNSSLLMKTALDGNRDIFIKLLKHVQDISIVDRDGDNVFHCVAWHQNDSWWFDELKKKTLHPNELKEMMKKKNNAGMTQLHCAASHNKHQSIIWLLANGADVNATDIDGDCADDLFLCDEETKRLIRKYRIK